MEVSSHLHAMADLPEEPMFPLVRKLGRTRGQCVHGGEDKNSYPRLLRIWPIVSHFTDLAVLAC
jgi:hypothetical protein